MKFFGLSSFDESDIPIESIEFLTREERSKFVYDRFKKYFVGRVLDVGCDKAPLRVIIGARDYCGLDLGEDADIRQDLNSAKTLPFTDRSFSTVMAIETLEHIDQLHYLFAECVRVADQYLIVSLPNCWRDARRPIERGIGRFAHYGLPVSPPSDRHRWFFNFSEGVAFLRGMSLVYSLELCELFGTKLPRSSFLTMMRKLRYGGVAYRNRYASTVWAVFKKG